MLKDLKVTNFGKIGDTGVILSKLTQVNFLVGENGSGKSSLLQSIYYNFQKKTLPSLNLENLSKNHHFSFNTTHNNKNKNLNVLYFNQDSSILIDFLFKNRQITKLDKLLENLIIDHNYLDLSILTEASGLGSETYKQHSTNLFLFQKKLEMVIDIIAKHTGKKLNTILLEEPEHYLHPSLIKQLALIFKEISINKKIQFIIATHSPFLITPSGDITEKEKIDCDCIGKSFFPSQKIYLLKDGKNTSKSGKTGSMAGSDGYWGRKVGLISAKMLGAGLSDFITKVEPEYTENSPYLVLCEGEGKNEDARIYNQIFANKEPRVLFVSCKGNTQTSFSFEMLEQVKNGVYGNFKIISLRDRDHEFPNDEDINTYKSKNPSKKVLYRRAIECYIFDSELVAKVFKRDGFQPSRKIMRDINTLQLTIQREVKTGIRGNTYKERLAFLFRAVCDMYNKTTSNHMGLETFKKYLVDQITEETKIYKELDYCIFR